MESAAVVTIVAVVLIVAALVFYLVSVIVQLRKITTGLDEVIEHVGEIVEKSAPVNGVVTAINEQLDAGVDLLEGLLVKKAGMADAVGLVEGLYAGSAAAGFRSFPESTTVKAPRIGEVYAQGTLTLARLGREAPIAVGNPAGPALRDVERGSLAARLLYPEARPVEARVAGQVAVIGTDSPVQYPPSEQRGGTTPDEAEIREKGRGRKSPPRASSRRGRRIGRAARDAGRGSAARERGPGRDDRMPRSRRSRPASTRGRRREPMQHRTERRSRQRAQSLT